MLDQSQSLQNPVVVGAIVTYVIAHVGSILGAYLSIRDRLTRIETKLDAHDKDLDGLGIFLGTERAKAQLAEASKLKV
jgi:hypothetical protein